MRLRFGWERRSGFLMSGSASASASLEGEGPWKGASGFCEVGGGWGSTWGWIARPGFVGWGVEGTLVIDLEDDRSRFKGGAGVGVETDVFLAELGRGGGCMGVCFDFDTREEPERASVGV